MNPMGDKRIKLPKRPKANPAVLDAAALGAVCKAAEQDKLNFGHDYRDNGLVFCQPNGSYYSPDRVGARVKEVLQKARGLSGFSLHSLLHSHASVLLGEGVPIAVVSERLGHADQNITLVIYSHALPTDVKAASKVWRNALADVISEDRSRKTAKKSRKV